ncbi:MAG: bifunctional diguanylate cyclase/phosphodiesterase [Nitrospiria bacterium]
MISLNKSRIINLFSFLRFRLFLLIFMIVLPFLGVIIYTSTKEYKKTEVESKNKVVELVQIAADNQNRLIEGVQQLLAVLSHLPEVKGSDPSACNALFSKLLQQYSSYANLGISQSNGNIICSGVPFHRKLNMSERTYFRHAIETGRFSTGNFQIGRITGKPTINFGYPLFDQNGKAQKVLFAALDLSWLNQLASRAKLPPGSTLTLMDQTGTILVRYPNPGKWVGKSIPDIPMIKTILSQHKGIEETTDLDGNLHFLGFTSLVGNQGTGNLSISIGIPKQSVFSEINHMFTLDLAILAVTLILGFLGAWIGSDFFVLKKINVLVKTSNQLAGNNLSARTGIVYGKGELDQLAYTIDKMADSLEANASAIQYQATHDSLTKLPNATLLHDRLDQAIKTARRNNKSLALLMLDINHFKEINHTLGHHFGNLLLLLLGPRLQSVLRQSDTIAHLGGDKFAILLEDSDINGAESVTRKILKVLEEQFILADHPVLVETCIGIALYPDHGETSDILLQRADVAMSRAKEEKSDYFVYIQAEDLNAPRRLVIMGALREAIHRNQLILHYQPKINLKTGGLAGAEALVRWQHPELGPISPDQFIPLAEKTGLIKPLTYHVLNTAVNQCQSWSQRGININVAVNLSTRNLLDQKLPDDLMDILDKAHVLPSSLEIEITESVIMLNPERAMEILKRLSGMGVQLSIDDFGTGYSSLMYLNKLPVNEIKIDKSFVINMLSDKDSAMIVRSTIHLAHNLGLKVVAEGVENKETLDGLKTMGCDYAQGFYISKPLSAEQFIHWLDHSPWRLNRQMNNTGPKAA